MSKIDQGANAHKCDAARSALIVIDIQERLGQAMPAKVLKRVVRNSVLLVNAAELLGVPVFKTEQYPDGLGPTLTEVGAALPATTVAFEKTAFSCVEAGGFDDQIGESGRRQMILVGMEAHVCVLQSAIDLNSAGFEVFVVEDAICSRRLENYENALNRMRRSPVTVVSAESVAFEWIGDAKHEHFKPIQKLLR